MKYQSLHQVFKIVEWKDGCVYKTKSVGYAWKTLDFNANTKDTMFCSISTSVSQRLGHNGTFRRVSDDTPDVVETST